jgi:hypothetical protein
VHGVSWTYKLLFINKLAALLRHGSQVRVLPRSPKTLFGSLDCIAPGILHQEILTHTQPTTLKPPYLHAVHFGRDDLSVLSSGLLGETHVSEGH